MHMATRTRRWTLADLERLPDDGNKYELVRGELFVTPGPTPGHEIVLSLLSDQLTPFVRAQQLGMVLHPRAVVRFEDSEVEPDLMVRRRPAGKGSAWSEWPAPILVVEVLSDSTKQRDRVQKRQLYAEAGVAEYWIIDPETRSILVVVAGAADVVVSDTLMWTPVGASAPLVIKVPHLFG